MMMVSRFSHPVSVASMMLAVALALSACGTTGKGTGLGSLGGGSTAQKPETSLLTSLGNGLLGSSANQLNAADRKKALEAEYRALEYSPAGKAVSWSGSGSNSGDVTAAQPIRSALRTAASIRTASPLADRNRLSAEQHVAIRTAAGHR